jgi:hypothetical protein
MESGGDAAAVECEGDEWCCVPVLPVGCGTNVSTSTSKARILTVYKSDHQKISDGGENGSQPTVFLFVVLYLVDTQTVNQN